MYAVLAAISQAEVFETTHVLDGLLILLIMVVGVVLLTLIFIVKALVYLLALLLPSILGLLVLRRIEISKTRGASEDLSG